MNSSLSRLKGMITDAITHAERSLGAEPAWPVTSHLARALDNIGTIEESLRKTADFPKSNSVKRSAASVIPIRGARS